jgi:hypothetical protein
MRWIYIQYNDGCLKQNHQRPAHPVFCGTIPQRRQTMVSSRENTATTATEMASYHSPDDQSVGTWPPSSPSDRFARPRN